MLLLLQIYNHVAQISAVEREREKEREREEQLESNNI